MRIAIIVPRLAALGPIKVMQTLVNCLAGYDGIDIEVFYLDKEFDQSVIMKVPVHRYNSSKFQFEDFDVIHTNGIRPDLIAYLNRRKIKCHISTIHSFVFDDLKYSYNRIISWIFGNIWLLLWSKADKLVCVSGSLKSYYKKWVPDERLISIHNGIPELHSMETPDNALISEITGFRTRGLTVLGTVSVLSKGKGLDQVLKLLEKESNLSLVLIGNGKEMDSLTILAKRIGVYDRVFFSGFRDNPSCFLKYLDVFLMPSRSEGFGLALVEAVQHKVPVVCSDIPVFRELFDADEVTFFKIDVQNSLSEALKSVVKTRQKKTEVAYNRYQKYYTDKTMAKNYYELYRSVL